MTRSAPANEDTDDRNKREAIEMHTEMAKTRDQLYLDKGITDTMLDHANIAHKLEDNKQYHRIMSSHNEKMMALME